MWQSLEINGWAKSGSLTLPASIKPEAAIVAHLRDFSSRILSPEEIDILPPESTEPESLQDEAVDTSEMAPFTLEEPDESEAKEPPIDLERIRAEAFEQGRQSLQTETMLEREKLVETHRQALNEARQTLINTMAGDLLATCQSAFELLHTSLESDLTQLIAALVGEKLTSQVVADFVHKLAQTAIEASQPLIIEGQQALLDAFILQAKTDETIDLDRYQLKINDKAELRLIDQDRVLSTRLAPLLQQLREII